MHVHDSGLTHSNYTAQYTVSKKREKREEKKVVRCSIVNSKYENVVAIPKGLYIQLVVLLIPYGINLLKSLGQSTQSNVECRLYVNYPYFLFCIENSHIYSQYGMEP